MLRVPTLQTERLVIREFSVDDLPAVRQLLEGDEAELARWLQWTVLSYEQLDQLKQPPYGDRAIVLRATGSLIGACGLVPLIGPYGQIPALADAGPAPRTAVEMGLFWTVLPEHQRRGYATEAGQALVRYALDVLGLRRILAATSYDNAASIAVMRKLGMRIERNPLAEPPWLQIVAVLNAQ